MPRRHTNAEPNRPAIQYLTKQQQRKAVRIKRDRIAVDRARTIQAKEATR